MTKVSAGSRVTVQTAQGPQSGTVKGFAKVRGVPRVQVQLDAVGDSFPVTINARREELEVGNA